MAHAAALTFGVLVIGLLTGIVIGVIGAILMDVTNWDD